jgi:hypothetical protein
MRIVGYDTRETIMMVGGYDSTREGIKAVFILGY